MKTYNNSVSLRNDGVDPSTSEKDLNAGVGINVTVRVASTPTAGQGALASIFNIAEDEIANPLQTDNQGNYTFKAPDGIYDIVIAEGTADEKILASVEIVELITPDFINNLSLPYVFDTVADYKAFATVFPVGKAIQLKDRGAEFTVIAGTVTANDANIIANTNTTQSIDLIIKDNLNIKQFGAVVGSISTVAIQAAFSLQQTVQLPIYIPSTTETNKYLVDGQLEYWGFGAYGDGMFNSRIESSYVGVLVKKMDSSDNGILSSFTLKGTSSAVAGVIGIGADGSGKGFFNTQIKNVYFEDMEQAMEMQFSLFCNFDTVYFRSVKRGIFFVGSNTGWNNTWYNNGVTFQNCIFDECSEYAIDFIGMGLAFSGSNTIQSSGDGIRIIRDSGNKSIINTLDNLYFEFNTGKDIDLKDTYVTLGPCTFQNDVTPPSHNIYCDNTQVYAVGRPAYLDAPALRVELVNNSKFITMYPGIIAGSIINDASSEFVYLPDRVSDKRKTQTFTNLSTTPVTLAPPLFTSSRYTDYVIEFMITAPNGDYQSFTTYGKKSGGSFRIGAVSGGAIYVSDNNFTVTIGGFTYTFITTGGSGQVSIESNSATTGDTLLVSRVTNSLFDEIY